MPYLKLNIPDTTQNIDKPVVLSVLKDLIRIGVIPKPAKTVYHEVIKSSKVPNRDNAGHITDPHPHRTKLLGDSVMIVEVERETSEFPGMSIKTMYHEGSPFIYDKNLGVVATPIHDNVKYNVNMVYTSSSRNLLLNIRDNIRALLFTGVEVNLHDIEYSVTIPDVLADLMSEIYKRREKVEPYNETIKKYLQSISSPNMVTMADGSGTSKELRWSEDQREVEGRYETTDVIDLSDNEDGTYTIEIGYTFEINKPIFINVSYPLIIHNQLLPEEYVGVTDVKLKKNTRSLDPATDMGLDIHSRCKEPTHTSYPIINPSVDNTLLEGHINGFFPIVQSLCVVGDDKRSLLNLGVLGENLVYDKLGEYLRETGKDFTVDKFKSLFHIRLFVNGKIRHMDRLEIDEDLIVKSKKDLNLRDIHHVVLYSVYDFNYLTQEALIRLIEHPRLMRSIAYSAYHGGLVDEFVYKAIVGTEITYKGDKVWLKGISTLKGYRLLQRVLLDIRPSIKTEPHTDKDLFDTIYQTDDLGNNNQMYQRTLQSAHTVSERKQ